MSTHELLHLAHSLGEALSRTDAWQMVQTARNNLMRDSEAYQLLARYQDANIKLERKNQDGLVITQAELDNMESIQDQLEKNPLVNALQTAQENFNQLMQSVYGTLDQALEGGCGEGCSSCGGSCGCEEN